MVIEDKKLRGVVAGEYAGSGLEMSMEFSSSEITITSFACVKLSLVCKVCVWATAVGLALD